MAEKYVHPSNVRSASGWELYKNAPKEQRVLVVSEFETIYGEAPSGAHEIDPLWIIWRETKDPNGRTIIEFAQNGKNILRWIYAEIAFDPIPDPNGKPYDIILDNEFVYDGMVAGLPVANITVLDIDDTFHDIVVDYDPSNKFTVAGSTLFLTNSVQLSDVAYPLRLKATDDDGNVYVEKFAIYVKPMVAPAAPATGEINVYEEDSIATGNTATVLDYTVPANRELDMDLIDCFGQNLGKYEILIDGARAGYKETYFTSYETKFDFDALKLKEGQNIKVNVTCKGPAVATALFTIRLRGYQYVV